MALVKMQLEQPDRGRTVETEIDESRVKEYLKAGWVPLEGKTVPEPVQETLAVPEVEIPEGIEDAHHFTKIKVARQIDPDFSGDSQAALELIQRTQAARQSSS